MLERWRAWVCRWFHGHAHVPDHLGSAKPGEDELYVCLRCYAHFTKPSHWPPVYDVLRRARGAWMGRWDEDDV